MLMHLHGLKIVPHTLAVRTVHEVRRHPIRKRRRGWTVVPIQHTACWQVGDTFYMHPDLVDRLMTDKYVVGVHPADGSARTLP